MSSLVELINMPLHLIQDSMQRSGIDGSLQESHWNLRFPPPAIESVDELVNIFLHVFVRHTMKGSEQKRFQIADHHMHLRRQLAASSGRVIFG